MVRNESYEYHLHLIKIHPLGIGFSLFFLSFSYGTSLSKRKRGVINFFNKIVTYLYTLRISTRGKHTDSRLIFFNEMLSL